MEKFEKKEEKPIEFLSKRLVFSKEIKIFRFVLQ